MSESQSQPAEGDAVATALRRELARGDAVLRSVGPVLRHVLAHGEHTLFSDDAIARVRGMLADLARQLAQGGDHGPGDWQARDLAVLAMQDGQEARLALMLRAGGARTSVIDENLLLLHPAMAAPSPWGALSAERAVSLLQATPAMED